MKNNFAQETLNRIIKECPKAWGEFRKFLLMRACPLHRAKDEIYYFKINLDNEVEQNIMLSFSSYAYTSRIYNYNYRNFFDYFDSKGKYIDTPMFWQTVDEDTRTIYWWESQVVVGYVNVNDNRQFNTRSEAEWAGIYNAFKIEEEELSNGTN